MKIKNWFKCFFGKHEPVPVNIYVQDLGETRVYSSVVCVHCYKALQPAVSHSETHACPECADELTN